MPNRKQIDYDGLSPSIKDLWGPELKSNRSFTLEGEIAEAKRCMRPEVFPKIKRFLAKKYS